MKRGIVFLIFTIFTAPFVLAQQVVQKRMPEDVAIFAVQKNGDSFSVDPVVIVHYGPDQRFKTIPALNTPLPSNGGTEEDFDNLEKTLYKPGTSLSVFSGGMKLGTAAVNNSNIEGRDGGCLDLSATITYQGTGTPRLAANTSAEIPGHRSSRRKATTAEASTLRHLAEQWLVDYGIDRNLIRQGTLASVVSTELRPGIGRAIIGRLDVKSKKAIYRLFAVAEPDGSRPRLTLSNLEIQNDLEDGTDKTERVYVDQLDINNDGQDEIITSTTHYESWNYDVWDFDPNHKVWGHKFRGTGGGC